MGWILAPKRVAKSVFFEMLFGTPKTPKQSAVLEVRVPFGHGPKSALSFCFSAEKPPFQSPVPKVHLFQSALPEVRNQLLEMKKTTPKR